MTTPDTTQTVPLTISEDGTIRITGSRVSLDSVVHHFELGATAEQIAHKFPSLKLADIYAVITYYLNHRESVKEYLRLQEAESDRVQQRIEGDPQYQKAIAEMRERPSRGSRPRPRPQLRPSRRTQGGALLIPPEVALQLSSGKATACWPLRRVRDRKSSRRPCPVRPRHLPRPAVARTAEPAAIRQGHRVGSPILESDHTGKARRSGCRQRPRNYSWAEADARSVGH